MRLPPAAPCSGLAAAPRCSVRPPPSRVSCCGWPWAAPDGALVVPPLPAACCRRRSRISLKRLSRCPTCSHHPGAAQQEHGQAAGRLPVPRGAALEVPACLPACAGAPGGCSAHDVVRHAASAQVAVPITGPIHDHTPPAFTPALRWPPLCCHRRPSRRLRAAARRTRTATPTPSSSAWAVGTPPSPSPPSLQTPCRRPLRGWAPWRATAGALACSELGVGACACVAFQAGRWWRGPGAC